MCFPPLYLCTRKRKNNTKSEMLLIQVPVFTSIFLYPHKKCGKCAFGWWIYEPRKKHKRERRRGSEKKEEKNVNVGGMNHCLHVCLPISVCVLCACKMLRCMVEYIVLLIRWKKKRFHCSSQFVVCFMLFIH